MKIQLSVKASKLQNVAGTFKGTSDPFAILTILANNRGAKPELVGKTEVIKNSLNPDWTATFTVDYELGTPMNVLVKVCDEVKKGENISMGSAVFCVGSVLGAKGNTKAQTIKGGGKIFIRAEKAKDAGSLRLRMSGVKLTNTDGYFNKSDPFYQFTKKEEGFRGTEWNIVHRSGYIKNDLNPVWPMDNIDLNVLCDGDLDKKFKLDVYDNEKSGDHEFMGGIETSVNQLVGAKGSVGFDLMKKGKKEGTLKIHMAEILQGGNAGTSKKFDVSAPPVKLPPPTAPPMEDMANFSIAPIPPRASFTDYISGGCEMNLCVAIDFTGSNGDPRKPGTLHYMGGEGRFRNDYERAISSIGSVLADFDHDKKFPVYGFGAKYGGTIQHCFQCGPTSEVDGVDGIIQAYRQTFSSGLVMSGPTVITEVLRTGAAFAVSSQEAAMAEGKQKYTTLLILTDGAVSDVAATARCINEIKNAPLSIVIVGIGSADFGAMQFLDDNASDIDIAQFVEFNAHKHDSGSLTNATLQEIPTQLESYFQRHGIMPNPPIQVEEEEIVVEAEEEEIDLTIDFGADGNNMSVSSGGVYVPPGAY
eukprot:CAMPEP_0204614494 /NCGR_PEP_ID=MMETSP0717-20131115/2183_1 /ASSEMBLY_ACC=CAM_ASM_000666 /TAXON_ID=230516 /ORGANISM="Chaetoceros curvisetus" /LENGTH=586 /DNA_ID=CAMNT_0051627163 /DNA_START=49 /DNA_END=1809 /DNA_ORIENTATION=-